jgi:hypothetical protein
MEDHGSSSPFVDNGMPIAEGETAGIVVGCTWKINPLGHLGTDREAGAIDTVGALIESQKDVASTFDAEVT